MERMRTGKGATHRFATLAARDLATVQVAHLKTRFELAERSLLAERAVALVNEAFADYEAKHNIIRVKPGELVVEHSGEKLLLPLLETHWVARLARDMSLLEVKRQHEHDQYCQLQKVDPEATYGDLWRLLGRESQVKRRAPKGYDFLPEEPQPHTAVPLLPRMPQDMEAVPEPVMTAVTEILANDYGCKPARAEAMIKAIAGIRAWCCPKITELAPGQMVWLAHCIRKTRRTDPKLFVPVILTVVTLDEQGKTFSHRGEFKRAKVAQIERITTEAWRQDGVLTNSDVEWLTGLTPNVIRELLEAYQEKFGIILPTAGTVLDMGRPLTHKKLVVEMALGGMTTREIARRIYHTPEAVDAYLRTFDKLLILRYYGLPIGAMVRVLGHGRKLIEEHLALADKHFPTADDLKAYLTGWGVSLENIC